MNSIVDTINPFDTDNKQMHDTMNIIRKGDASKLNIHSFLMAGQSNMAGRGSLEGVLPIVNPNCFMLRMGKWQFMSEPVNVDRGVSPGSSPCSGASLAAAFAEEYAHTLNENIGLIPCADGGTTMDQWMPGSVLFDHAVMQTKLAMRTSRLCGILWHQGESDCSSHESVEEYHDKFIYMIRKFREELGQIPVLIGELGYSENGFSLEKCPYSAEFNRRLEILVKDVPDCALVSAKDLKDKGDGLHFCTESLREFGKRYFEQYHLLKKD